MRLSIAQQPWQGRVAPCTSESWEAIADLVVAGEGIERVGEYQGIETAAACSNISCSFFYSCHDLAATRFHGCAPAVCSENKNVAEQETGSCFLALLGSPEPACGKGCVAEAGTEWRMGRTSSLFSVCLSLDAE